MAENQKLTDLILNFISFLSDQQKSPYTIVAYKKDLLQMSEFLAKIGKKEAEEVASVDLEAFLNQLAELKYTPKSIARKLNAIKGFFRWLRGHSLIAVNPALSVAHPKYELHPPRVLSVLEYRALRDAARSDPRTAAIIEILLQTGMRISEVANLTLTNMTKDEIKLKDRTIPLNGPAKEVIDNYLKIKQPTNSQYVFITKTGRPILIRNVRSAIERCFAQAGIEHATVNDLRNTFIVHQISRGVDLLTVSRIVGHKRLTTTERYLEVLPKPQTTKLKTLSVL